MLNIYEDKQINFDEFINLGKKIGVLLNENLIIKKIFDNNYGIFAKNNINPQKKLISIPKKLLISYDTIKNLILSEEVDYPNLEFLKLYFNSIPNFQYFRKNYLIFHEEQTKSEIFSFFIDHSPTKKKLENYFMDFHKFDDLDKYLFLIFRSRAFNIRGSSFLVPILDMANYKFGSLRSVTNESEVYYKNENILQINEEFFQGYGVNNDIVSFYLHYNFIPDAFNNISIPPNFFSLNISDNNRDKLSYDYWNVKDGKCSNKSFIVFDNLRAPFEFNLEINKILSDSTKVSKFKMRVLELLKNEIKIESVKNFLNKESSNNKIYNFVKALEINYIKISEAIKNLDN